MKKLGFLLLFVSLGMFAYGCGGDKKEEKKTNGTEVTAPEDGGTATDAPPADTPPADEKKE